MKRPQIPKVLAKLVSARVAEIPEATGADCDAAANGEPIAKENPPIAFTCPDCGGALLEIKDARSTQLRCHVGHRFSLESFSEAHADAVERAVWVALRKLKERMAIHEQLAKERTTSADMKKRFKENAASAARDIELLEEVLAKL